MRWDGQRVEQDAEQALPGIPGLVRSVRAPEFAEAVFHEVLAKSVLNKVPEGSRVPFRWTVNPYRGCTHACSYCLHGDTPVLMADGTVKPISKLAVGDRIYGTERRGSYRHYVPTEVLAHWSTVKPAYRVTLADGTALIASGDHRFLTERGWKHVTGEMVGGNRRPHLTTGNKLMGTGRFAVAPKDTADYRRGYLAGVARGDGGPPPLAEVAVRVAEYLDSELGMTLPVPWPRVPTDEWRKGLLAGVFDIDGTYANRIVRLPNLGRRALSAVTEALAAFDFRHAVELRRAPDGKACVRVDGGLAEHMRLFHTVDPAVSAKRAIDGAAIKSDVDLRVVSVAPLGLELPLYDITTGTGDFIANGVVSHNCFARSSHTYLDFDAGSGFDSQIVVKVNAPEVLAKQLAARSWKREPVAMGTNTDPYQRAEGRYRLMPGVIGALAASGTPFSILTKGTVLSRDLPLLAEVGRDVPVSLAVSIALLDRQLQRSVEPGTPGPQARLDLVRRITDAGLPCAVMVAPVLPGLTDSAEQLDALLSEIKAAGADGATMIPLRLPGATRGWYLSWLARFRPDLVAPYQELYRGGPNAAAHYRDSLAERFGALAREHGLDRAPARPAGPAPEQPRQLTLL
ncbi:intein-containing Rv2578c family radical SAM protein [Actinokineospora guangxiensis]|uniref:Intein-containing Rv2578c family radical SAM protein n=1 Tax=Actinokineospora guangxiensis TaxID=1490288 RepID=A0ABW0EMN1_9PSEU